MYCYNPRVLTAKGLINELDCDLLPLSQRKEELRHELDRLDPGRYETG